jgi:hypothetical protein
MQTLIRSLMFCLVILAVAANGRFAEIIEDGLSDGFVGSSIQADSGHQPNGPDDGSAAKSSCHGAIGCHVLFVAASTDEIEFLDRRDSYADFESHPIGKLAFDQLRPPIFQS